MGVAFNSTRASPLGVCLARALRSYAGITRERVGQALLIREANREDEDSSGRAARLAVKLENKAWSVERFVRRKPTSGISDGVLNWHQWQ